MLVDSPSVVWRLPALMSPGSPGTMVVILLGAPFLSRSINDREVCRADRDRTRSRVRRGSAGSSKLRVTCEPTVI